MAFPNSHVRFCEFLQCRFVVVGGRMIDVIGNPLLSERFFDDEFVWAWSKCVTYNIFADDKLRICFFRTLAA